MTEQQAMRMALEALERSVATCFDQYAHEQVMSRPEHFVNQTITALRQALEQQDGDCQQCGGKGCVACDARKQQPADEHKLALHDATQIATWLWKNFYKDTAPQWEVLPNICGVLSQIDNMVAGLKYSANEPVAWMWYVNNGAGYVSRGIGFEQTNIPFAKHTPLYTRPQPAAWVGLTDEEIEVIYEQHHNQYGECESVNWGYERAIEAKLKEKNT